MNQIIHIDDVQVHQDAEGRYCLNDLHRAAGYEPRHRPSLWTENQQVRELILALDTEAGIPALVHRHGGSAPGTYVARELVYAYAMWVSAAFHLKVIRTFDAVAQGAREAQQAFDFGAPAGVPGTYVEALQRVIQLQQQLLQARPVSVHGVQVREVKRVEEPRGSPRRARQEHPWTPSVRAWAEDNPQRMEVSSSELLHEALGLAEATSFRQASIGQVMSRLGWRRARRRTDGKLRWVYVRPGAA
ncbi:MAG: KilA-N domain-containing protein [Myxococcaceae bacterium]|nr:KilA-N domain-containing protein [Myxococcaceae bacterium]